MQRLGWFQYNEKYTIHIFFEKYCTYLGISHTQLIMSAVITNLMKKHRNSGISTNDFLFRLQANRPKLHLK